VKNRWPYRVDGELGRFEFPTYRVCQDETTWDDTAREVFVPLGGGERYQTAGFKEIAFMHGVTEPSYHKTARLINRIRHQEGATGATTWRASAEREGQPVMACRERTTAAILHREGCDETGQPLSVNPRWSQEVVGLATDHVKEALDACDLTADERAEVERNPVLYERPAETVNLSIDAVVVKHQKPHRTCGDEQDEMVGEAAAHFGRTYVHHPVAHLQHPEASYGITGQGVATVLRMLLGYLLTHALLGGRVQFFVDGQKTLQAAILRAFTWFSHLRMLLDWYHLEDKGARQLSLAMKGAT